MKLHVLTSPRINCKLPGCLQIPKMLWSKQLKMALIQVQNCVRLRSQQVSCKKKKKRAAHSSAASFSGAVIPQCNVALCFFRRRFDQKSRLQTAAATSCLASLFLGEMVRSYCTMLLPENIFSLQFERKTSVHSLPAANQQRSHKLKI